MTALINALLVVVLGLALVLIVVLGWWTRSWPDPRKGAPLGRVKPRKEWL